MNNSKPILAIETSEKLCSAAVYFSDDKYFQSGLKNKYSHAEKLMDAVDYVLKSADIKINELDTIAVSAGPGSFTGLRIGMSAAKGLAYGSGLSIIPVPTFEAMALQISEFVKEGNTFIIANKVNSDEIYYAKFQIKDNSYIFVDNLKILKTSEFNPRDVELNFGNISTNNKKLRNLTAPDAVFVAKWAMLKGNNHKIKNFDYLEPDYLKNFVVKARKNV